MHFSVIFVSMEALQAYLHDTFGVKLNPRPLKRDARNLPLYLQGNFEFYSAGFRSLRIVFAVVKEKSEVTPNQLQIWTRQINQYMDAIVVFVFDSLESWLKKRLIEKKISFAVPSQQLFIPDLLIQLTEGSRKPVIFEPVQYLSFPAQVLLLYHLQVGRLEQISFQQLGELLKYSAMTISRAVKELAALQLVKVDGAKVKYLQFQASGLALWDMALPHLQSPLRESWYSDKFFQHVKDFRSCNDTALAAYTMLAESQIECLATGKETYRALKEKNKFPPLYRHPGPYKLEVWQYDPVLLSEKKEVDKLSLFLSMQDETDERVQGALKELLNDVVWL